MGYFCCCELITLCGRHGMRQSVDRLTRCCQRVCRKLVEKSSVSYLPSQQSFTNFRLPQTAESKTNAINAFILVAILNLKVSTAVLLYEFKLSCFLRQTFESSTIRLRLFLTDQCAEISTYHTRRRLFVVIIHYLDVINHNFNQIEAITESS